MLIKCTDRQVCMMAAAAVNASKAVGMGQLHYDASEVVHADDIMIDRSGMCYIDYWNGRMVKFYAQKKGEELWDFAETTKYDYQSWKGEYADYNDLFKQVCEGKNEA